jgi:pimeloyl-ACP methyl ester carboxylesterase
MRLPDGRTLGFAEHGRSSDYPLLFMHGYPSSRLETLGIDEVAYRHNIRIITPDRNGFGLTSFDPKRKILDWPADIQALAQHLGLTRFAVLGGSGGSPFALACAYRLPPEMLSAVGIMGGAGPWEAGAHHMALPYRLSAFMAHYCPSAYGGIIHLLLWMLRRALSSPFGIQRIDKALVKHFGLQGPASSAAKLREIMARQIFEAFRQGTGPAVYEAQLLTSSWGIKFEDVMYNKIRIWHGKKDANAPVEMMRYMAERLPHCELTEFSENTHFTLQRYLDQILSEMVPK